MNPANANLTIYQGATWSQNITWRNGLSRALIDVSGYSARMQVRSDVSAAAVLVELTTANGRITLGGINGKITLALSAAETAALAPGTYVYDLELVVASEVTRVLQGNFIVIAEVTR